MFSLQKLSLIRLATTLCNNRLLLNLILQCPFVKSFPEILFIRKLDEWEAVHSMANALLAQVSNCIKLQKKILKLLWPISWKIMLWKFVYASHIENKFLEYFHWTSEGRIDKIKTAENIICNKNIYKPSRFILACSLCLNKETHEIWAEMSNNEKAYFRTENNPLILFWISTVESIDPKYYIMDALKRASELKLPEAVTYLFSLLTADEKNIMVVECARKLDCIVPGVRYISEDEINIVFFLFSQMNCEDREYMFKSPSGILLSFILHSKCEHFLSLLLQTFKNACLADNSCFLILLFYMYHFEDIRDYDYLITRFFDVWRTYPPLFRDSLGTLTSVGSECLRILIEHDFPFLLKENALEKVKELTSPDLKPEATTDFPQEKWEILLMLIQEKVITIDSLKRLKKFFTVEFNSASLESVLRYLYKIGTKLPLSEK